MITIDNYFSEVERIGLSNFPEVYRKSHDFVVKNSDNGNNWDVYRSNAIVRNAIDVYFSFVNKFISTYDATHTEKSIKTEAINKSISRQSKSAKTATREQPSLKKVQHLREEIKFIKRYVGLHNKVKSPNAILSLLKALQRAIVQKLISKTSPLSEEIELMQSRLVNAYNNMRKPELFEINEKDLGRLVVIAGGEEVYPSIKFIKRFIGMQERDLTASQIGLFTKQLKNAVDRKKILKDDPYADKLNAIYNRLKTSSGKVSLTKSELTGLSGIVKACSCYKRLGKIFHPQKAIALHKKHATLPDGVLTAEQMANRKLDLLEFTSKWFDQFGKPGRNFTMMIHGEPQNGKTVFLLMFAKYLAENFGKVLYVSSEEFSSPTMTEKTQKFLTPFPARFHFSENLSTPNISDYQFIIFDSINDLGITVAQVKEMRQDYPQTAFIFILQHTKDGKFKGGKDWEHLAEIVGEVSNGAITMTKNRYALKSTMDFLRRENVHEGALASPKPYPVMQ